MPRRMSIEEAYEFLDSKPGWIALTTIGPDGFPHTVPWVTSGWTTKF